MTTSKFSRLVPRFVIGSLILTLLVSAASAEIKHVVHISVDGLRVVPSSGDNKYLQDIIDEGGAPHFKRFQTEGAWTNNARADFEYTNTLPNHATILTARPVVQPAGQPATTQHGWTHNSDPGTTLHDNHPHVEYVAGVFDVAHDAGLSTGLYASKTKFAVFERSYDASHGADHANGKDKIDFCMLTRYDSDSLFARFKSDLRERRIHYTFLHFNGPDTIGHRFGWGSAQWQDSVKQVDGYLGQLFALIENGSPFQGKTIVILTADHGGTGNSHLNYKDKRNYTVPLYVWGPGVARGDLYAMNDGKRKDPGESRPDYNAAVPPIRAGGTANLALSLLGLGPIPGSSINAKQDLAVLAPAPEGVSLRKN